MNPLVQAIKNKNYNQLRLLIELGHNVNVKDEDENSLLKIAVEQDVSIDLIRLIVESGADVDITNRFWSHFQTTPLFTAIWRNHIETARLLIAKGADINKKDNNGIPQLLTASFYNSKKVAQLLLTLGADANIQDNVGTTPLFWAIEKNNLKIVKILIANGAKMNNNDLSVNKLFNKLLNHTILLKDLSFAKLLMQATPNLNQPNDKSRTPLFYAIEFYHPQIFELLILHSASPELLPPAQQKKCAMLLNQLKAQKISAILQSLIKHQES